MNGITLVELLMTLIIVSIIMGSIYNVLQHAVQAHDHVETGAEVTQNARMAVERLVKEVRQARSFEYGRADDIQFSIDSNGDGDNEDDGERIEYSWDGVEGSDLRRRDKPAGANPAWRNYEAIANYVSNFAITYRDGNNTILSPPVSGAALDAIMLISADLSLEKTRKGAKGKEQYPVSLRATAHPRNR